MREALIVLKGKKQGEIFILSEKGQTIVGRGEKCEVQLNDPSISRRHFCITKQNDKFFLQDMGSSNGTLVNNKRTLWQELNIGDFIVCGAFQLQFTRVDPGTQIPSAIEVEAEKGAFPSHNAVYPTPSALTTSKHNAVVEPATLSPLLLNRTFSLNDLPADILIAKQREDPPFTSYKNLNRLSNSLSALYKVLELLHRSNTVQELAKGLLHTILSILKAERCCLLLNNQENNQLEMIAYQTSDGSPLTMLSISRSIVRLAVEKGTATVSSDAMSDQRFCTGEKASVVLHNIRSVMCVPLEGKEHILGALYIDCLINACMFDHEDLDLLTAIGRQAGLAIERTVLQEIIARSEEKYRTIFQKSPLSILLVNRVGRILDINPVGIQKMAGGNIQSITAEVNILDLFSNIRSHLIPLLEKGEVCDCQELPVHTPQGQDMILNLKGMPLYNNAEEIEGALIIFEDITEAKRMQHQIIQQDKMATMGLLVAGVAHEFNNIIAGMMGYAQLMLMGKKTPERLAQVVVEQCSRAREIIERLLNFSRRKDTSYEAIDLASLLEDVFQLVERELYKNNIRMEKQFGHVPKIIAHAGEMQQVFLNLVMNAVHAIGKDGTLTVILRRKDPWIQIIFHDTGTGIPKDIIAHLFEPFFTTKAQKGTGLGLSVSNSIIQSYKGNILVESEENKGATFTIQLPVPQDAPPMGAEEAEARQELIKTSTTDKKTVQQQLDKRTVEIFQTNLSQARKNEKQDTES